METYDTGLGPLHSFGNRSLSREHFRKVKFFPRVIEAQLGVEGEK